MNCIYCNNPLCGMLFSPNYSNNQYYTCNQCKTKNVHLKFIFDPTDKDKLLWIQFTIDIYILEIHAINNYFYLLKPTDNPNVYKIVLELDKAPDINPKNAKQWLNRLLKLKVFS